MKKEVWALIVLIIGIIIFYARVIYDILKKRKYNLIVKDEKGIYRRVVREEKY